MGEVTRGVRLVDVPYDINVAWSVSGLPRLVKEARGESEAERDGHA